MRYIFVLSSLIALLALACGGGGEAKPTATAPLPTARPSVTAASETPGSRGADIDLHDLALRPEDVPSELGRLSEPQVIHLGETTATELYIPLSQEQIDAWGVVSAAVQFYSAPEPYPQEGARFMFATVLLADASAGAQALFAYSKGNLDRQPIENYEAQPGRSVLDSGDVSELAQGDEFRAVRYISESPGDAIRLETYFLIFRRERAVGTLGITAREGNVTREQVHDIAASYDRRIQEGLR